MNGSYAYAFDWFSGNIPVWEVYLGPYAGRPGLTCIEIGSWEGRSAVWLLENVVTDPSSILHCVDTWSAPNGRTIEAAFDRNMAIARHRTKGRLVKHRARSADVLPGLPAQSADVVYVDGSHVASDVLSDIVLSWRLLKLGGLLVLDDYELTHGVRFKGEEVEYVDVPPLERPKMAIDAFLACFEGQYRLLHKAWQLILIKTADRLLA